MKYYCKDCGKEFDTPAYGCCMSNEWWECPYCEGSYDLVENRKADFKPTGINHKEEMQRKFASGLIGSGSWY